MKKSGIYSGLVALFGYFFISLLFTYPLILHFNTHLVGAGGDALQFVWAFWHMKTKLLLGLNPFWAPEIFYPLHVNLMMHTWTPVKALMAVPLLSFFNMITTYNILFLFSYIMTALGGYFFLGSLGCDKRAAFLGGMLVAFSPNQMGHGYGHFNLISTEAIPWILYVWKIKNLNQYLKSFLLASLSLYLLFCDYNLFVFMLLLLGLFFIYQFFVQKQTLRTVVLPWVPMVILFFVFSIPFWIMVFKEIPNYSAMSMHGEGWGTAEHYGNNILSFLLPSPFHPWWGQAVQKLAAKWEVVYNGVENISFFGYLPLGLLLFGLIKFWKDKEIRFWFYIGTAFVLFSLGTYLQIAGLKLNALPNFYLFSFHTIKVLFPMPYTIIHYLPFINGARIPGRFVFMAFIAGAAIIGLTLTFIFKTQYFATSLKKNMFFGITLLLILFEYLPAQFILTPLSVPEVYNIIKADKDVNNVVLDLPSPPWAFDRIQPIYYQTIHGHKIVGGWTARDSKEQTKYFFDYHAVKTIGLCDPGITSEKLRETLDKLHVVYLVAYGEKVIAEVRALAQAIPKLKIVKDTAKTENVVLWQYQK